MVRIVSSDPDESEFLAEHILKLFVAGERSFARQLVSMKGIDVSKPFP